MRVFDDRRALEIIDDDHSADETRLAMIGLAGGRLLYVVFTERGDAIRIIHARKADRRLEKLYDKGEI